MELTGKCKEDFEKHSINNQEIKFKKILGLFCVNIYGFWIPFYLLPYCMKYGVYVDFFDSLDVFIYIIAWETEGGDFYFKYEIIGFWGNHSASLRRDTRQEARDAAIEKADELHNNKNK
jgi:hypothetical protein